MKRPIKKKSLVCREVHKARSPNANATAFCLFCLKSPIFEKVRAERITNDMNNTTLKTSGTGPSEKSNFNGSMTYKLFDENEVVIAMGKTKEACFKNLLKQDLDEVFPDEEDEY